MEKKTQRFILALTPSEKYMLGSLAQAESEATGEIVSQSAIIRKLVRDAYNNIRK